MYLSLILKSFYRRKILSKRIEQKFKYDTSSSQMNYHNIFRETLNR